MKAKLLALIILLLICGSKSYSDEYPKIDVTGFKKWEYRDVKVNPQSNYFLGLTHLGGYSPTVTGGPWQERLQLGIMGQLNDKLSVTYDVEQQPESPDKYDVKVNYDNKHQLTFGDFTTTFTGNEFVSTTKFLNGVMLSSKDINYDLLVVPSAKLKSQIQGITSQKGNNSKGPYSLGHGSIVEGSERIELNSVLLQRGTDYLIDYFEGKVTFNRILSTVDEFKYSFEFTNLIDIFFPSLSKKDFFGAQGRVTFDPTTWGVSPPQPAPVVKESSDMFPMTSEAKAANVKISQEKQTDQDALLKTAFYREKLEKVEDYLKQISDKYNEYIKNKNQKKAVPLKILIERTKKRVSVLKDQINKIEKGSEAPSIPSAEAVKSSSVEKISFYKEKQKKIEEYLKQISLKFDAFVLNKDWKKATPLKQIIEKNNKRLVAVKDQIIKIESMSETSMTPAGSTQLNSVESVAVGTAPTVEISPKISERNITEESSGRYRLTHLPLVPFSEVLVFKGTQLKKNEDYTIRYDDGYVVLLTPVLPDNTDQLKISYKSYDTALIKDKISATGSRGPYQFSKKQIVVNSEKIYVDKRFVVRDFDYTIDFATGKITFVSNVSNTSIIEADYTYRVFETPAPPPPPKYPKSLTLGMTYLKESSKKSVGEATASNIESKLGQDIIKNDNTIYLAKFPIMTSAEGGTLIVKINGLAATPEVDYSVPTIEVDPITGYSNTVPKTKLPFINNRLDTSNGYSTGTIKILASLEATSEVTVLYNYKQNIVGRYSGIGIGSRGPYYIKGFRNILPGSERLEVLNSGSLITTVYVRNSSFEGDAGDKGYSIDYSQDNPSITFNNELLPTQNYSIYFQYIAPSQASSGSDLSQDLTGFDAQAKLGDILQFDGNFARSNTDQVITAITSTDSFSQFLASTNRLALANKPVVENSEKVFVNSFLRNKDIDYFVDYTTGSITFFYITLTTRDVVSVDYEYQSQQGVQVSQSIKTDTAYKYGVKSNIGKISMAFNDKKIGFDFNPLGGTAIGVGSNYRDFSVGLAPTVQDFTANYAYRETNNPIGSSKTLYTRNYDRNYSAAMNPLGLASINLAYRNLETKGDTISGSTTPSSGNSQNSYSIGFIPKALQIGPLSFTQRYDGQRTLSEDLIGHTKGNIKSGHVNYALGFTDRIKLGSDFQISEPITLNTLTGEVITAHSLSRDLGYDASFDLTIPRIKKLSTYVKLLNHESINLLPLPETNLNTRNTTYHVDFSPFDMLSSNYDYNRQETPSVLINGINPKTERSVTNINLAPHPAFSTGFSHSEDLTVNEAALRSSGLSNNYNATWNPISYDKIKLGSTYSLFDRSARSPLGTIEVQTRTNSFIQDYTLTLNPFQMLTIAPGFTQEEYFSSTSTATTELKTRNQTVKCKMNFNPIDKLTMAADYSLKITTSLNDNINRHKSLVTLRTGYKVFTWGELVHNLEEEHNEGEVQAGGILPNIDYLKTSNTFSLNFNIPQENPILNSVVLTATYKLVRFENRINPADNLFAYLMTFEGTLNF